MVLGMIIAAERKNLWSATWKMWCPFYGPTTIRLISSQVSNGSLQFWILSFLSLYLLFPVMKAFGLSILLRSVAACLHSLLCSFVFVDAHRRMSLLG